MLEFGRLGQALLLVLKMIDGRGGDGGGDIVGQLPGVEMLRAVKPLEAGVPVRRHPPGPGL